jgi:hypothetical protein
MTKLVWDAVGERRFEAGVDRGVLYLPSKSGVPWNGLVSVKQAASGGESKPYYIDGVKYLNESAPEEYVATLEAFTYPREFAECDGTAFEEHGLGYDLQPRKPFNLSYRTGLGNDVEGMQFGYKIHLLYNATAAPSAQDYTTQGASVNPSNFSWTLSAIPLIIPGRKPTPHLIVDSTLIEPARLLFLETILYGTRTTQPRMPTIAELNKVFQELDLFKIVPDDSSGQADLVISQTPDLIGYADVGIYSAAPNTRLKPTSTPGIYRLDK